MAETEDQPGEPALVPLGQVFWNPPDRRGKRLRRVIAASIKDLFNRIG